MIKKVWYLASERGETMVAVLIAIVLVSVAVVALSGTTVYVMSMQTESGVRSTAAGIAAAYMEEVKTRSVVSLGSEPATAVDETGAVNAAGPYNRQMTVTTGAAPKSRLVKITVYYPRGKATQGKVEMITIVYEGVDS